MQVCFIYKVTRLLYPPAPPGDLSRQAVTRATRGFIAGPLIPVFVIDSEVQFDLYESTGFINIQHPARPAP